MTATSSQMREASLLDSSTGYSSNLPTQSLWSAGEFLAWLAVFVIGFGMLAGAWYLASGEAKYADQIGPLDMAVGGLILALTANVMWVLRARKRLGERSWAEFSQLRDLGLVVNRADRKTKSTSTNGILVAGRGTRYFHRPDCPLVSGRAWPQESREALLAAGLAPCGMCQP